MKSNNNIGLSQKIKEQAKIEEIMAKNEAKFIADAMVNNTKKEKKDMKMLIEKLNLSNDEKRELYDRGFGNLLQIKEQEEYL